MPGLSCFSCSCAFKAYFLLVIIASVVLAYIVVQDTFSRKFCPPCLCHCPSRANQGFGIWSPDWTKLDISLSNRNEIDLLKGEIELRAALTENGEQKDRAVLHDAKKMASQYQKLAEKCNMGLEICEEAREKAQEALLAANKVLETWKSRAEIMGWKAQNVSTMKG